MVTTDRLDNLLAEIQEELDRAQQYISAQNNDTAATRLMEYCNILKGMQTKYAEAQYRSLLTEAYQQLDLYLDKYLQIFPPDNVALFNQNKAGILLDIGKNAKLTRYPLAHIFIITIPEDDANAVPPIWTSMAHELGHFVYWNSKFPADLLDTPTPAVTTAGNKEQPLFSYEIADALTASYELPQLQDQVQQYPATLKDETVLTALMLAWAEEIFADTVGTLVANEDFVMHSKDAYLAGLNNPSKKRFVENDSDHPYSFLRPYISATAQAVITQEPNNFWRTLKLIIKNRFSETFLQSLGIDDPEASIADQDLLLSVSIGSQDHRLPLDDLKQAIGALIVIFVAKIKVSKPLRRTKPVWEFIEEFENPQPLLPNRFIQGVAWWLRKWIRK